MHNFKELKVWQKSMDLSLEIYHVTKIFPPEERYGLTSQMRRAAVAIPSNIAEGCAKSSNRSFSNSLEISLGESFELETQTELCNRIGFISQEISQELMVRINEFQKMILGLKSSLEK